MPIEDGSVASESSVDAEIDVAATPKGESADAAESSAANDVGDTLSIVRDVVNAKDVEQSESSTESEEGDRSEDEPASRVVKEPDYEHFSDVPFHKHPRFQQLVSERNEYRTDAQAFRNIKAFQAEYAISDSEAADALLTAALVKSDPVEAWKRMKPMVEQVLIAAGEILPPELEQQVHAGVIPREFAVQLSRQNAATRALAQRQQFEQHAQTVRQQSAMQTALEGAAATWERDRIAKDPNFAAKQQEIMKEVLYLQKVEGKPDTADGVRAMLDKAYKNVSKSFRPPQRKPAARPSAVSQSVNTLPEPKGTLGIIRQVTARRAV